MHDYHPSPDLVIYHSFGRILMESTQLHPHRQILSSAIYSAASSWIALAAVRSEIFPEKRTIIVYVFAGKKEQDQIAIYSFDDTVPCSLWPDFSLRLADHL